jgi:hypothetical protein
MATRDNGASGRRNAVQIVRYLKMKLRMHLSQDPVRFKAIEFAELILAKSN